MTAASSCRVCGAPTDAFLCGSCADELEQAIAELPADVTDLEAVMTRQASGPLGLGLRDRQWEGPFEEGSLGDAAWEFAPGAADQLWAIRNTATTWVRHLIEARGDTEPPTSQAVVIVEDVRVSVVRNRWRIVRETHIRREKRDPSISDLATWLVENINAIRYDEAAAEIYDELVGLHTENERWIIGRSQVEEFLGYCDASQVSFVLEGDDLVPHASTCGVAIYGRQGESEAKCEACGTRYDSAERHAKMWASEINDRLARAHDIANALTTNAEPLSPTLLRKWLQRDADKEKREPTPTGPACEECLHHTCSLIRRRLILPRDYDEDDKPLYRVGDVRERLARVTEQRGAKLSA